jgi:hypothetical protein
LRQRGRGQRDARRRDSGNQCEFDLVDHGLSPKLHAKRGRDAMLFGYREFGHREMCSVLVILN